MGIDRNGSVLVLGFSFKGDASILLNRSGVGFPCNSANGKDETASTKSGMNRSRTEAVAEKSLQMQSVPARGGKGD